MLPAPASTQQRETLSDQGDSGFLALGIVAAFVGVGVTGIGLPGLMYDEVLFVNAALGGIDDNFVHLRLWGVPVLLMEYIGALKAWLYVPVFGLWGVTPESIRVPACVIMALGLYVNGRLATLLFGRFLGLVLLVLLATDPAYLFASRIDLGPNAIMSLMKALSLFLFFSWIQRPSNRLLIALFLCLGIGVFDKVNFVWFVVALAVAALTFHPRVRQGLARTSPGSWIVLAAPAAAAVYIGVTYLLPLFINYETGHETGSVLSTARLQYVLTIARETLTGRALRGVLMEAPAASSTPWVGLLTGILSITLFSVAAPSPRRERTPTIEPGSIAAFFLVLQGTILLQIIVTRQATGPHHMFALHPDGYFLAAAIAALALRSLGQPWRRHATYGLVVVAGVVMAIHAQQSANYLDRTRSQRAFTDWSSPGIYLLSRRIEELDPDVVVSAQWGLHNQLFALAPPEKRGRYRDRWGFFTIPESSVPAARRRFFEDHYEGKRTVTLLHAAEVGQLPGDRGRFLAFREETLHQSGPPEVLAGPHGRPLYEIYITPGK